MWPDATRCDLPVYFVRVLPHSFMRRRCMPSPCTLEKVRLHSVQTWEDPGCLAPTLTTLASPQGRHVVVTLCGSAQRTQCQQLLE